MYELRTPGAFKGADEVITHFFDTEQIVWTRGSGCLNLFIQADQIPLIELACGAVFRSFTLSVAAPRMVADVQETTPDTITWYQYAARLRGITGQTVSLGDMDTVIQFHERDDMFAFVLKRVKYRETTRRYVVTGTQIVMSRVRKDPVGNWKRHDVSVDVDLEADLVKFGGVVDPSMYWSRRTADAANIDWSKPALAKALKREVLRNGE